MTKTFTTNLSVKLFNNNDMLANDCESEIEIDLFYDQIKEDLNSLIKNPQDETIAKILNYSKSK